MKTYVLKGNPIALARARYGERKVYDAQRHLKLAAGLDLMQQHESLPLLEGPLHMDVVFFMPMPQKLAEAKKKQKTGSYHVYRPDLSNLVKFVEDVGTGILYKDDAIIASINCRKVYSPDPRTEFSVKTLTEHLIDLYRPVLERLAQT